MKKFGFGLMRLPTVDGDYTKVDLEKFQQMADAFIAAGGTYFDTAYPYHGGFSEQAFREVVVKRYSRDRFTITDKMPIFLVKEFCQLQKFFDEQLERCGVEYFDYYWLHAVANQNYDNVQKVDMFRFLREMKEAGKIRHIGFSFHDGPKLLDRILTDHPEVEFVQLQINYLDWEDPAIRSKDCYDVATRHGKPVIVMEPIKGGSLVTLPDEAEKALRAVNPYASNPSWALRFAANLDNVMMVLSGMSNIQQMEENLNTLGKFKSLSDIEQIALHQATQCIREGIAIPCTGCRYCVSENTCPKNIAIPDYFALYNDKKSLGGGISAIYYRNFTVDYGKASDCIECGLCEGHCPQHLEIRKHLKDVANVLE